MQTSSSTSAKGPSPGPRSTSADSWAAPERRTHYLLRIVGEHARRDDRQRRCHRPSRRHQRHSNRHLRRCELALGGQDAPAGRCRRVVGRVYGQRDSLFGYFRSGWLADSASAPASRRFASWLCGALSDAAQMSRMARRRSDLCMVGETALMARRKEFGSRSSSQSATESR